MLSKLSLLALAATAPLASAIGNAAVLNKCPFPVALWSVGSTVAGPAILPSYPAAGSYWAEDFRRDPTTGGIAIKITRDPNGLYNGSPQLVFAYALNDNNQVYYDLSTVFGDAFAGYQLIEQSDDQTCPKIYWANGTPPGGSQVKTCTAEKKVGLTLCA